METVAPVLAVAAVLALIAGIFLVSVRMEKARAEALSLACQALGFSFEPDVDLEALKGFGDLPIYSHGHSRKAKNLMTGRAGELDVKLFDYQYTTGGGKNSHTWRQSVALFPKGGEGLPDFLLAPENLFHKIGQAFGYQDIDFDSAPDFSSHYLLRGPDEMAIRSAFGAGALQYFGMHKGWHVEVRGGDIGVYRAGNRAKPEDLRTFFDETHAAVRVLKGDR